MPKRAALVRTLVVWAATGLTAGGALPLLAGAQSSAGKAAAESPTAGRGAGAESTQVTAPAATSASPLPPGPPPGSIFAYQGLRVRDIQFRGVESGNVEHLRQLLAQKQDEPLDRLKIRHSIQALYATGRFADIQVEAERAPQNEVSLVFVATQNYFVGEVIVEGAPKRPSESELVNASKLQLGELFTSEKLKGGLERMRQLMTENGYYRSSITPQEKPDAKTQLINIYFRVVPGRQAHIGQVMVTGNAGYPEPKIRDIARMHPGDTVSAARLTSALQRLRKRYQKSGYLEAQVSNVDRVYHPDSDAVDYILKIVPGPTVDVHLQGAKLRKGLIKKHLPIYEESAVDEDLLSEGRSNLRDYFQTQGYFDVQVQVRREFVAAENHLHIIYVIQRGIRHKLVRIDVSGNQYFDTDTIHRHLQIQTAGRVLSHGLYSQSMLNRDLQNLLDLYHANGFEQAKINSQVNDDYQGVKGRMAITLPIEEGPQTLVGALMIGGAKTIPEDQLRPLLTTAESQPYSEYNMATDRDTIMNYYFNRGFPEVSFQAEARPAAGQANRMDVTYTITEGEQFFVNQVLLSGLNYTRPYVAQRELQVHPGEPISQLQMLETQRHLYDLGLFNQVNTAVENPDGKVQDKNVLVQVQESKRYTFNYGIGFEAQTGQPVSGRQPQGRTGVSPRVSFDVTRLNFRGRDHTISFRSHLGRLEQLALVSYDAPRWFNREDLRLTFTAFYDNTLDVNTFTSERLEGSAQAEQTLNKASTLVYRFTYRRVRALNLVVSPELIPLFSQPVRVGMPSMTYIRDKRDNPIDTHKGNYTTVDLGAAAGFFGSQASFSRFQAQNSTYHELGRSKPSADGVNRKYVFARSTRLGVENVFGKSQIIPLPERFLAGGGNSLRGFAINQAGPRDIQSGSPLGGDAVFINNLELRFPPLSLPYLENNMSFVVFHDAGNVFASPHDMLRGFTRLTQHNKSACESLNSATAAACDFNYLSQALGAGIRYKTPIGPLRFDFGYNLNPPTFPVLQGDNQSPLPHIETARHFNFYFSIGQTF